MFELWQAKLSNASLKKNNNMEGYRHIKNPTVNIFPSSQVMFVCFNHSKYYKNNPQNYSPGELFCLPWRGGSCFKVFSQGHLSVGVTITQFLMRSVASRSFWIATAGACQECKLQTPVWSRFFFSFCPELSLPTLVFSRLFMWLLDKVRCIFKANTSLSL